MDSVTLAKLHFATNVRYNLVFMFLVMFSQMLRQKIHSIESLISSQKVSVSPRIYDLFCKPGIVFSQRISIDFI